MAADFQRVGESEDEYHCRIFGPFDERPDSLRMCYVEGCVRERFDNWTTCEEHESRGSRIFDR